MLKIVRKNLQSFDNNCSLVFKFKITVVLIGDIAKAGDIFRHRVKELSFTFFIFSLFLRFVETFSLSAFGSK